MGNTQRTTLNLRRARPSAHRQPWKATPLLASDSRHLASRNSHFYYLFGIRRRLVSEGRFRLRRLESHKGPAHPTTASSGGAPRAFCEGATGVARLDASHDRNASLASLGHEIKRPSARCCSPPDDASRAGAGGSSGDGQDPAKRSSSRSPTRLSAALRSPRDELAAAGAPSSATSSSRA